MHCKRLVSTPGGALPSISLSFSLATILPPEPKDFDFSYSADGVENKRPPILNRHSLWLRLRWYLIIFDPLTFVLD